METERDDKCIRNRLAVFKAFERAIGGWTTGTALRREQLH
jgi:hypothetical protein